MSTNVIRVPTDVHSEATRVAALRGQQPGQLLAEAWREFMARHRDEFATELEEAARLMRNGTAEEMTAFANRSNRARAEAAAARIRAGRPQR